MYVIYIVTAEIKYILFALNDTNSLLKHNSILKMAKLI